MKKMIIASTSTVHGSGYLEYLLPELKILFKEIKNILFIPYARPDGITHDEYTAIATKGFKKLGISVTGIHTFAEPCKAIKDAKAVFIGGGNTFLLVTQLYSQKLIEPLKQSIEAGIPYLGASAGSNICGPTMQTTNDMPIVYPPNYKTLNAIPFNINPHYLDPDPYSTHKGETRETRIKEFHSFNDIPVIGLREGSWLNVNGNRIILGGNLSARFFRKGMMPIEVQTGADFNSYLPV